MTEDTGVGFAEEFGDEAEDTVAEQEQARDGADRPLLRRVPPEQDEQQQAFARRLVERRGMARQTVDLALLIVEITDLVFAVDSIPAIFAITPDPFIVFTSNIFAILGLRALYFCLAALITKFRFLKPALILILA